MIRNILEPQKERAFTLRPELLRHCAKLFRFPRARFRQDDHSIILQQFRPLNAVRDVESVGQIGLIALAGVAGELPKAPAQGHVLKIIGNRHEDAHPKGS